MGTIPKEYRKSASYTQLYEKRIYDTKLRGKDSRLTLQHKEGMFKSN